MVRHLSCCRQQAAVNRQGGQSGWNPSGGRLGALFGLCGIGSRRVYYNFQDVGRQIPYKDKAAYNAQKKIIADEFIKVFEERFPYAIGKVEVVDVSTPYTYNRYTGTWK